MTEPALLSTVIAHRGASASAPENTLAAISLAHSVGATCVELDASISSDNIPFIHHDNKLDRCTNGSGLLCEHDAAALDLVAADAGMSEYAGESLPRLSAAVGLLSRLQMGLNLEIKPSPGLDEPTAVAVCDVIRDLWPSDLPLVLSSFSQEALSVARDTLPGAARALIVGAVPADWHHQTQLLQCRNLHTAASQMDENQSKDITNAGLGLYCYTVNQADEARKLLSMGVHGVFTDYPAEIIQALSD